MKLVAKLQDSYVNIPATSLIERADMIFVYNGENLVGVFDLGFIGVMYLSPSKDKGGDDGYRPSCADNPALCF